jgi:hypothetical protein
MGGRPVVDRTRSGLRKIGPEKGGDRRKTIKKLGGKPEVKTRDIVTKFIHRNSPDIPINYWAKAKLQPG